MNSLISPTNRERLFRRIMELDRLYLDADRKTWAWIRCQGSTKGKDRLRIQSRRAWKKYEQLRGAK